MPTSTQRQDQASCTLTVNGRELPFVFNKRDGGMVDSETSKSFPGGGRKQRAHGAPATVEDVTLNGEMVPDRDHDDIQWLKSLIGSEPDAGVVENALDGNGAAYKVLNTWTGVLKSVNTGSYDANSADPREFEVEVTTHGEVGP
jgi:hypothetical protein